MATVVLGAARTPFTKVGGGLASVPAVQLGADAARGALERAGVAPTRSTTSSFGQVVQAGVGHIPSRQVSLGVGVPENSGRTRSTRSAPRACVRHAGRPADPLGRPPLHPRRRHGVDVERAPTCCSKGRYGIRFGDAELLDAILQDGLRDPWTRHADVRAGERASPTELGLIEREPLDEWALRSHQRAIAAIDDGPPGRGDRPGRVRAQGRPRRHRRGPAPRHLAWRRSRGLRPLVPEHPTHTAGNSPGVNDGAAALVLADEDWARERGSCRSARIRGIGYTANRHDSLARVPAPAGADRARAGRRRGRRRSTGSRSTRPSRRSPLQSTTRPRRRPRARERERRRDRARPPDRRLGRAPAHDARLRAAPPGRRDRRSRRSARAAARATRRCSRSSAAA